MDFDIRKPTHLLSLVLISITFFVIIILPIFSFLGFFPTTDSIDTSSYSKVYKLFIEIFTLIFQLAFVMVLLIIFPLIWYFLVNKNNFKQAFSNMRLSLNNIDNAVAWGIISTIVIYGLTILFGIIIIYFSEIDTEQMSNIPDLEAIFSPVSLFVLVAIQPIAEEIFFRGFLLDKTEKIAGTNIAIILTAVLFGLAHASYGKIYPIVLPIVMGVILAYIVIKTKSLYAAITAHVCYNVGSLALTYLARSYA